MPFRGRYSTWLWKARVARQNFRENRDTKGCRLLLRGCSCVLLQRCKVVSPLCSGAGSVNLSSLFRASWLISPWAFLVCHPWYVLPLFCAVFIAQQHTLVELFLHIPFLCAFFYYPNPESSFPRDHDAIFFSCHNSTEVASTQSKRHPSVPIRSLEFFLGIHSLSKPRAVP